MADPVLTARRVRIVLRCLGFLLAFFAVMKLLFDFISALFGPERLFGDFFFREALLGVIQLAAGMFLMMRSRYLAGFLAEDRES